VFRKLHTHFVLTAMSLLTAVLVVSFVSIYISTAARLRNGPGGGLTAINLPAERFNENDFRAYIEKQRQADADQTLRELAITLVVIGAVTLAVGYFISQYLAGRAIGPVEEAYERQRQFVADASHELKTPLAVIDANLEAELVGKKKPSKWLQAIQNETGQMNRLIANLLLLARADTAAISSLATFDLSAEAEQLLATTRQLVESRSLTVSRQLTRPLPVHNNKDAVRQIITIFLDNAIKYTPVGGTILLETARSEKSAIVSVTNAHSPIAEEKLAKLFDRFYQTDESHHGSGHGLGLAIAKSTAESIGAGLEVTQSAKNITFTLTLPLEG
jgi:signal transduction histidine kinase